MRVEPGIDACREAGDIIHESPRPREDCCPGRAGRALGIITSNPDASGSIAKMWEDDIGVDQYGLHSGVFLHVDAKKGQQDDGSDVVCISAIGIEALFDNAVDKLLNRVCGDEYRLTRLTEVADSDNVHEDSYERRAGQLGHVIWVANHIEFSIAPSGNLYMLVATIDGWSVRHEEDSNRGCVRVQNACGFIHGAELRDDLSVIWRAGRSVFGVLQVVDGLTLWMV